MGTCAAGAHERDGLRLGLHGGNGHSHLAYGAVVPDGFAISVAACCWCVSLELGRVPGSLRNCSWRQHRLPVARVSALRGDHFVRRLHARCLVGSAHVPLSARRTNLHYAMVFARRVSLVSVAVCGWAIDAVRRTGAGRFANGSRLVVCEQSLFLWFGAIALGTAYYMIPKVIGRPVYSYHLATIGFWTYALFSSWTGMQRLIDGPFPAWMITASIAATILTMIPVATVGLNHHMTMQGYFPLT